MDVSKVSTENLISEIDAYRFRNERREIATHLLAALMQVKTPRGACIVETAVCYADKLLARLERK